MKRYGKDTAVLPSNEVSSTSSGGCEREEEDDAEPSLGWTTLKGMAGVFPFDRSRETKSGPDLDD